MVRWAVFVSGRGTNLKNVLQLEKQEGFQNQSVVLVHANRDCPALQIAKDFEKDTHILSPKKDAFCELMFQRLRSSEVTAIFLLGYMKILSEDFIEGFWGPIVNLHPSILPAYKGLNAIERAYAANEAELGVSLHEVTPELDSGKVLRQKTISRQPEWSLEEAEERVHQLEYQIVGQYLFDLEAGGRLR